MATPAPLPSLTQPLAQASASGSCSLVLLSSQGSLSVDLEALEKLCFNTWKVSPTALVASSSGLGEVSLRIDDFAVAATVAEVPHVVWEPTSAGGAAVAASLMQAVRPALLVNLPAFIDGTIITRSINAALRRELGMLVPSAGDRVVGGIEAGSYVAHVEMLPAEAAAAVFARTETHRTKLLAMSAVKVRSSLPRHSEARSQLPSLPPHPAGHPA